MNIGFTWATLEEFSLGISKYAGFQDDGSEIQILDIGVLFFTVSLYFYL